RQMRDCYFSAEQQGCSSWSHGLFQRVGVQIVIAARYHSQVIRCCEHLTEHGWYYEPRSPLAYFRFLPALERAFIGREPFPSRDQPVASRKDPEIEQGRLSCSRRTLKSLVGVHAPH